jgi:hypothetical protein
MGVSKAKANHSRLLFGGCVMVGRRLQIVLILYLEVLLVSCKY